MDTLPQLTSGLDGERVPKDVTHVIVDGSVTIIKRKAFKECKHLVSTILGDNVKRIADWAFYSCRALRFIRFSRTLEYIGGWVFFDCESLEALFLPSTVKSIEYKAFSDCRLLRLILLPNDIDIDLINPFTFTCFIDYTAIPRIGRDAGVGIDNVSWLIHRMDESPFHKLCYDSSVTIEKINTFLNENGNRYEYTLQKDASYNMCLLHILVMNPHAPINVIVVLLNSKIEAASSSKNEQKTPLDYARDYNVSGLVAIVKGLCIHKNASALPEVKKVYTTQEQKKKRKIDG